MVIAPDFDSRPIISFQSVWKRYANGTEALKDVSLAVPEGDFIFLVGPSGAGKSTMVRLLIREEKPTRGRILVDGINLGPLPRRKLPHFRRKVGLVFQDFKLLPRLTVYENVAFALRVLGESKDAIERLVGDALETVGLANKGAKYPRELSGGEQQRVARQKEPHEQARLAEDHSEQDQIADPRRPAEIDQLAELVRIGQVPEQPFDFFNKPVQGRD